MHTDPPTMATDLEYSIRKTGEPPPNTLSSRLAFESMQNGRGNANTIERTQSINTLVLSPTRLFMSSFHRTMLAKVCSTVTGSASDSLKDSTESSRSIVTQIDFINHFSRGPPSRHQRLRSTGSHDQYARLLVRYT